LARSIEAHGPIGKTCRELGLPYLSILGPVLGLFQSYLGGETKPRIGAQHTLNAEYFKRIDALNYTMLHDDGQHTDDLEQADVVLVGVSRTSKTPTSIYLANRGVKTATYPGAGCAVPPRKPGACGRPYASPDGSCRSGKTGSWAQGAHADHISTKAVAERWRFAQAVCDIIAAST
jgi:hypothetical protein